VFDTDEKKANEEATTEVAQVGRNRQEKEAEIELLTGSEDSSFADASAEEQKDSGFIEIRKEYMSKVS
jgi:hypothetical protein